MTVVVCFNVGLTGAVMVADSRLTYHGTDGRIATVRDACQKIFIPSAWSLVGFAADDLCLGNDFARLFFQRIQTTEWSETTWLESDDAVRELARRPHDHPRNATAVAAVPFDPRVRAVRL